MSLDCLHVDLDVVLGKSTMPLGRFLRLGRGATLALDQADSDHVEIRANGHPIATGRVSVAGSAMSVEVLELARKPGAIREPGATIGGPPRANKGEGEPADQA